MKDEKQLQVSVEIRPASGEIVTAAAYNDGGIEKIISGIEDAASSIVRDVSTAKGRGEVKSLAYKITRSKTALDGLGKDLVSGLKEQCKKVDSQRKLVRDRLDALKDEVRAPLTAWEKEQEEKAAELRAKLRAEEAEKAREDEIAKAREDERQKAEEEAAAKQAEAAEAAEKALEENKKRAANIAHQREINKKIVSAMVADGISDAIAKKIITGVVKGKYPNIKVEY